MAFVVEPGARDGFEQCRSIVTQVSFADPIAVGDPIQDGDLIDALVRKSLLESIEASDSQGNEEVDIGCSLVCNP